jgi:hypothetical protein
LYTTIKTYFWIKSDKNVIENVQYNQKLNNIKNVFYNKDFIDNFFNKIIKHPRCNFGFMKEIEEVNLKDFAKID